MAAKRSKASSEKLREAQSSPIPIRFPVSVLEIVDLMAQRQERSRSWIIKRLVRDQLIQLGYNVTGTRPPGDDDDS